MACTASAVPPCTAGDFRGDVFGRFGRLIGQPLHFGGNDGKPFTGIPGPGGFDRRIQGQQIGFGWRCR